jgi:hypothetical protein
MNGSVADCFVHAEGMNGGVADCVVHVGDMNGGVAECFEPGEGIADDSARP